MDYYVKLIRSLRGDLAKAQEAIMHLERPETSPSAPKVAAWPEIHGLKHAAAGTRENKTTSARHRVMG
jgi:hypothetical protein